MIKTVNGTSGHRQQATVDRITVALVPKAADDLRQLIDRTGLSKTDAVNRALTLYEYIDSRLSAGDDLLIRSGLTGESEVIKLL